MVYLATIKQMANFTEELGDATATQGAKQTGALSNNVECEVLPT